MVKCSLFVAWLLVPRCLLVGASVDCQSGWGDGMGEGGGEGGRVYESPVSANPINNY